MTSATTLVLFDIDGTLVHTGRAGLRGMNAAIGRLFGRADAMNAVPFAGRTDRAIVSDVLRKLGRGIADEDVFHVRQAYLEDLAIEITRPPVTTSSIATSWARRSGFSRSGSPLPRIAIFARVVRRASIAAITFGLGIVP